VRVREGGDALQTIELDRAGFACMLGGADGDTLFIRTAEWRGSASMPDTARTGRLLAVQAPAPVRRDGRNRRERTSKDRLDHIGDTVTGFLGLGRNLCPDAFLDKRGPS
jgi:hypothetical protein